MARCETSSHSTGRASVNGNASEQFASFCRDSSAELRGALYRTFSLDCERPTGVSDNFLDKKPTDFPYCVRICPRALGLSSLPGGHEFRSSYSIFACGSF